MVAVDAAQGAQNSVGGAQAEGAAAGAGGVEQIEHTLEADFGGQGDVIGIEVGKAGADAAGKGDDAADGGGQVVGALVADHLKRHAGRDGAQEGGVGGVLVPCAGERGEESAHGRAAAGAGDVHVHGLAEVFAEAVGLRKGVHCG